MALQHKKGSLHPIMQQSVELYHVSFKWLYFTIWHDVLFKWHDVLMWKGSVALKTLYQVSTLRSILFSFRSFVSLGQRNRLIGAAAKSQVRLKLAIAQLTLNVNASLIVIQIKMFIKSPLPSLLSRWSPIVRTLFKASRDSMAGLLQTLMSSQPSLTWFTILHRCLLGPLV